MTVWKRVGQVMKAAFGFAVCRKRVTVAVVVVLLLLVPLALTGDGEVFVLNAIGLGVAVLIVQRLARFGRRRRHGDR